MSDDEEDPGRSMPAQEPGAPYEPPRLIPLGNLNDLLGKTGKSFDNPRPHTGRP
jgi:hypothetical protein